MRSKDPPLLRQTHARSGIDPLLLSFCLLFCCHSACFSVVILPAFLLSFCLLFRCHSACFSVVILPAFPLSFCFLFRCHSACFSGLTGSLPDQGQTWARRGPDVGHMRLLAFVFSKPPITLLSPFLYPILSPSISPAIFPFTMILPSPSLSLCVCVCVCVCV